MEGMEKFVFKPAVKVDRPALTLHFTKEEHERFLAGCRHFGIQTEKVGQRMDTTKQQALVKQMIDHCLTDMGL